MTRLPRTRTALVLALGLPLVWAACATPQVPRPAASAPRASAAAPVALSPEEAAAPLPLDPSIVQGKLENGLSYSIRPNRRPAGRADLWLAVDTGSVLEEESERGLAHFLEHMAFNGTARYPAQKLVLALEGLGMRFGPDINAWTSFDETVYTLTVPTDRPEILDSAFAVLGEWACCLAFDPAEVEQERGVILEEWRLGRGAGARLLDRQLPVLFQGSRYGERLPIGLPEVIRTATPEALRRFYQTWYRPDRMVLVAVGDFDPKEMEARIRDTFGKIPAPATAAPRPTTPVPDPTGTVVSVATDPEATATSVGIYAPLRRRPEDKVGDYRRSLVEALYHSMLNARLDERIQEDDPPFYFAASTTDDFVRTHEVVVQTVLVPDGSSARGLSALLGEIERVRRFGFTATELERSKQDLLRFYERAAAEGEKLDSSTYAAEFLRNYFEGEPVPGLPNELALVQRLLPTVGLADVDALADQAAGAGRLVLVSAPERPGVRPPQKALIEQTLAAAARQPVTPYVDRYRAGPLVENPPSPGTIAEEKTIPEIGVTEWRLSNGVRVVLKPTDFQNDEVLLLASSPGGLSLIPDQDYLSGRFAPEILRDAGLGRFDRVTLGKALAGKVAGVESYLTELEEGLQGRASPRDVEALFQLAYLTMTRPRIDPRLFQTFVGGLRAGLSERQADPAAVFRDRLTEVFAQGSARRRPLTPDRVHELNLAAAERVYRERFGDASDFTFLLVGSFQPETLKPLVLTWFGGLPAKGRKEQWIDHGPDLPQGKVEVRVQKGLEPRSQVWIAFPAEAAEFSREARSDLSAFGKVLEIRLREVLREDLGKVYGVSVDADLTSRPRLRSNVSVGFGCAPENVDELVRAVFTEIATLRENGASDDVLQRVREIARREREARLQQNVYWIQALDVAYQEGFDPRELVQTDDLLARLTPDRLRDTARAAVDPEHYVLGVLDPEKAAGAAAAEISGEAGGDRGAEGQIQP
jgi:zinc protease